MTATLVVEELHGLGPLEALEREWRDLWRRSPAATPFQSPHWLIPWSRRFGTEERFVLVLRRGARLVGVMPFFVWERDGRRTLFPAGISASDYLDGTFAEGEEAVCAAAVIQRVTREDGRWEVVELQELRSSAALLGAAAPAHWSDLREHQSDCPVLPIAYDAPLSHVPQSMRGNIRYYAHRAARLGEVRLERATGTTFPALFASFARLHEHRWRSAGRTGIASASDLRELCAEAGQRGLAQGLVRLYLLFAGERPVAGIYGFLCAGRFHCYLTAFDPDLPQLSPGTLAIAATIEAVAAEGATAFDFLRGRERYKYLWGAVDNPTWLRRLERSRG